MYTVCVDGCMHTGEDNEGYIVSSEIWSNMQVFQQLFVQKNASKHSFPKSMSLECIINKQNNVTIYWSVK